MTPEHDDDRPAGADGGGVGLPDWLECVVNVSEGRDRQVLARIAAAAGDHLLDVHSDAHHHRSVLTVAGPRTEAVVRAVAEAALERIDVGAHRGAHPRLGAVDVVPFVPLGRRPMADAVAARDRFGAWIARAHGVPAFRYGPDVRDLPVVRREAFRTLVPDWGPDAPHPTAGAVAVGARGQLVAFNVWLEDADAVAARAVAVAVRCAEIRALALDLGGRMQLSMNLVAPYTVGPAQAYDAVVRAAAELGARAVGAELVGLLPGAVLASVPRRRREELGVSPEQTLEARIGRRQGRG